MYSLLGRFCSTASVAIKMPQTVNNWYISFRRFLAVLTNDSNRTTVILLGVIVCGIILCFAIIGLSGGKTEQQKREAKKEKLDKKQKAIEKRQKELEKEQKSLDKERSKLA